MEHTDEINNPTHYVDVYSDVECIELCGLLPFTIGSAVKYIFRAGLKGGLECAEKDIRKAIKNVELFSVIFDAGCVESEMEFIIDEDSFSKYINIPLDNIGKDTSARIRLFKSSIIKLICTSTAEEFSENKHLIIKMCNSFIDYCVFILNGGIDDKETYFPLSEEEINKGAVTYNSIRATEGDVESGEFENA